MNIALHDSDKTNFPNLALMKISSYHKRCGDIVSFFSAIERKIFDKVYSSKVFSFTAMDKYIPENSILGGTGYGNNNTLPDDIEHIVPDYSLYGINYSMGFLTRGCIRKCEWCVVPKKEGYVRANADIEEFTKHRSVVLLDNNVLSHPHGIHQIEKIISLGLRVDFNQGLDARLIDNDIAKLLSKVKWLHPIRLACDHKSMIPHVRKAVENLGSGSVWFNNIKNKIVIRVFCANCINFNNLNNIVQYGHIFTCGRYLWICLFLQHGLLVLLFPYSSALVSGC